MSGPKPTPFSLIRVFLPLLLAAAPFATIFQSASADAAVAPRAATVTIANFAFGPSVVGIRVGDTVTWINNDDDAHSVIAEGKAFRSTALDSGDRFAFTFHTAGVYAYHCGLHPHMLGKIVVTP